MEPEGGPEKPQSLSWGCPYGTSGGACACYLPIRSFHKVLPQFHKNSSLHSRLRREEVGDRSGRSLHSTMGWLYDPNDKACPCCTAPRLSDLWHLQSRCLLLFRSGYPPPQGILSFSATPPQLPDTQFLQKNLFAFQGFGVGQI